MCERDLIHSYLGHEVLIIRLLILLFSDICMCFCRFLISFEFSIMCGNINYFLKILEFIIFILFPCHVRRKYNKNNKRIQANLEKHMWQQSFLVIKRVYNSTT